MPKEAVVHPLMISFSMAHVKVRGVILKLVNVKDYDRYLTILTRDHGLLSVYAKRIRSRSSKLSSKAQLFSFADFVLFENKGRYHLEDIEIAYTFRQVREDMLSLTAASQVVELILDHTHEEQEARIFYELYLRFLCALEQKKRSPFFLTWLMEMRIMDSIGYPPPLETCLVCERAWESYPIVYFDFNNAGVLCKIHGEKESKNYRSDVRIVNPELIRMLILIEAVDISKLFALQVSPELEEEFGQFITHYLEVRLDKRYDKFQFFREFGFLQD